MTASVQARKKKRGFTLVEVLMGVFILSIGIVSILGAFPLGMRIVYRIKRTTVLCTFAASKMAEFQAYANPMGTLCSGEDTASTTEGGIEVNPFVAIASDGVHKISGIHGDRKIGIDYGIQNSPNGQPGSGSNGDLRMRGAGKHLHWKMSDFDTYIRSSTYRRRDDGTAVYNNISTYSPDGNAHYDRILDTTYRMGLTQNERRYREAYGFTRRYVIEVFEYPQNIAKTDKDYDTGTPPKYNAYYAFSTAVWNPHIFHSTEWSPVIQINNPPFSTVYLRGQGMNPNTGVMETRVAHDYFWNWGNEMEGWGFSDSNTMRYIYSGGVYTQFDKKLTDLDPPPAAVPGFPWK